MSKPYNLPKGYLSYSSINLWKSSKDQFRMKYYSTDPYDLNTAYTAFGKEIAEALEDPKEKKKHPVLKKVPGGKVAEEPLEVEIEGVPIKGYLDSFCPKKKKIYEYKTGIRNKKGQAPWDPVKVRKHDQLLLYSLGIKERDGDVDPNTTLVWLETAWAPKCTTTEFGNQEFEVCEPGLILTGEMEVFEREIEDWEHERMKQLIVDTALEITEDYTRYQSFGETGNPELVDNSVDNV